LVFLDFYVYELVKLFFAKSFAGLFDNNLDGLNVTHDATNHQRCQLLYANFTGFKVTDQQSFVEQNCVFALKRLLDVHWRLPRGAGCG